MAPTEIHALRSPSLDFNLQFMGAIYEATGGKADEAHRHDYYTVLLITKAAGEHLVDFNTYPFGEKQVFFVSPGQLHQVIATDKPDGWVITFSREFLMENNIAESFILNIHLFKSFTETPPLTVDDETFSKLQGVINNMVTCMPETMKFRKQALGALLQVFLIFCNNSLSLEPTQTDEEHPGACMIRDFKDLLEQQYRNWHKVGNYAKEIVVTPKHLSSTIKQLTGKTAKEWIQERLTLEAKRLLLHSDLSIKEIAYELGFEEPIYLSAFFKKQAGIAPSVFRKAHGVSST